MPPITLNPNLVSLPSILQPEVPTTEDYIALARAIPYLFQLDEQLKGTKEAADLVARYNRGNVVSTIDPVILLNNIYNETYVPNNKLSDLRTALISLRDKIGNMQQLYSNSQQEADQLRAALNASNTALNAANAALNEANIPIQSGGPIVDVPPVLPGTQQTTTTTTSVVPVQPVKTNYAPLIAGVVAIGLLGAGAYYMYKNKPGSGARENPLLLSSPVEVVKTRKRSRKKGTRRTVSR